MYIRILHALNLILQSGSIYSYAVVYGYKHTNGEKNARLCKVVHKTVFGHILHTCVLAHVHTCTCVNLTYIYYLSVSVDMS